MLGLETIVNGPTSRWTQNRLNTNRKVIEKEVCYSPLLPLHLLYLTTPAPKPKKKKAQKEDDDRKEGGKQRRGGRGGGALPGILL